MHNSTAATDRAATRLRGAAQDPAGRTEVLRNGMGSFLQEIRAA